MKELALRAQSVSKCYELYGAPRDRLKQFMLPRLQRAVGMARRSYYREFWSLRDVSFSLERGQTLGIVGRNGAGKSTLLQILCGTLTPTAGQIEVRGRVAALLELGAGFNPEFTGRENVFMAATLLGLALHEVQARFDAIAAFADIGEFLEQPVKTYSSGMYVRLAFAIIAHVDADILIIDEALAVGDAYFAQKCMRFLRRFREHGTLLFVSHDASAVVGLCDRALWLEGGRLVEYGAAKAVMEHYLADLYGTGQPADLQETQGAGTGRLPDTQASAEEGASFVLEEPSADVDLGAAAAAFGAGGARIEEVHLLSEDGRALAAVQGGETVRLDVQVRTAVPLARPIVGFIVKDRLGQHLFGENTFVRYRLVAHAIDARCQFRAQFVFRMPTLPRGDYSIAVAVADGTQDEHVIHEWKHDALLFQSHSASVTTGLVGIPMQSISLSSGCALDSESLLHT